MSTAVTEWEFTGDVVSWINELIAESPELPFSRAKTEQRAAGSAQRRDVTLLDRHGNPAVTGEIKLPDKADGGTPFNNAVVQDGRAKAQRAKVRYFFTWNVNTCVLWDTERAGESPRGREYRVWQVARVRRSRELAQADVQKAVRRWLATFLEDAADVVRGNTAIGHKLPDEKFMDALEAALEAPIRLTADALGERYLRAAGKKELDDWMRGDQGWTIHTDPAGVQENLERAARFACFALVNSSYFTRRY